MEDEKGSIVYGDEYKDAYFIVKLNNELVIVNDNYYNQENSIILTVGHKETDWSEDMLFDAAKEVVDLLNEKHNYDFTGR